MKKLFALLASAVLAAAAIPRISPARQNVAAADKIKIMPLGEMRYLMEYDNDD